MGDERRLFRQSSVVAPTAKASCIRICPSGTRRTMGIPAGAHHGAISSPVLPARNDFNVRVIAPEMGQALVIAGFTTCQENGKVADQVARDRGAHGSAQKEDAGDLSPVWQDGRANEGHRGATSSPAPVVIGGLEGGIETPALGF